MLYWLTGLSDGGDVFNLFRYITFRAGAAFFTALIFGFLFGRPLIDLLRRRQGKGQPIRDDGPQSHLAKAGTPTMGGLLILSALLFSTLLWARLDNAYVWIVMGVTFSFGVIGFADDYAKVTKQTSKGVSSRLRFAAGLVIAGVAAALATRLHPEGLANQLALPVFKDALVNLGWFFVPFSMVVIVGAANAVNLTDGLDGLAVMPVMIAAGTLGVIAYVVGRTDFSAYLGVHFVPGTGELFIFTAALIGSGVHGRHRQPCPWRRAGCHRGLHKARDRAGNRRRPVRGRGAERDHSGALFQAHRATGISDGADPSPFREKGLGRAADRDPVLDHQPDPRADRARHAEAALSRRPGAVCPRPC